MPRLITFGQAASKASPTVRKNQKKVWRETYKQLCSRCGDTYVTSLGIEHRMGKYRGQNGICEKCRDYLDGPGDIRKAQLALALRRKEMKLKW